MVFNPLTGCFFLPSLTVLLGFTGFVTVFYMVSPVLLSFYRVFNANGRFLVPDFTAFYLVFFPRFLARNEVSVDEIEWQRLEPDVTGFYLVFLCVCVCVCV